MSLFYPLERIDESLQHTIAILMGKTNNVNLGLHNSDEINERAVIKDQTVFLLIKTHIHCCMSLDVCHTISPSESDIEINRI